MFLRHNETGRESKMTIVKQISIFITSHGHPLVCVKNTHIENNHYSPLWSALGH